MICLILFYFGVVAIVLHSTIGLTLVSEAPARLRFEPSIVCFELLISILPGIINHQHFEPEAVSVVIVARCTRSRKEVPLRQNERCYRVCALLIRCK